MCLLGVTQGTRPDCLPSCLLGHVLKECPQTHIACNPPPSGYSSLGRRLEPEGGEMWVPALNHICEISRQLLSFPTSFFWYRWASSWVFSVDTANPGCLWSLAKCKEGVFSTLHHHMVDTHTNLQRFWCSRVRGCTLSRSVVSSKFKRCCVSSV